MKSLVDSRFIFLILLALAQTVTNGIHFFDSDIINVLDVVRGGNSIDSIQHDRQFLLEGLGPNALGAIILRLGFTGIYLRAIWCIFGLILLLSAVALSLYYKLMNIEKLIILLIITRIVATLAFWIGKSDPYLVCFLFLAGVLPVGIASGICMFLAFFCHPDIALIGTAGLFLARLAFCDKLDTTLAVFSLIGFVACHFLTHMLYPGFFSRQDYVGNQFSYIVLSGVPFAFLFFWSNFAFPMFLMCSVLSKRPEWLTGIAQKKIVLAWYSIVFFVSLFLVLDHTRDMTLITLPFFAFLSSQFGDDLYSSVFRNRWIGAAIVAASLSMPQLNGDGFQGMISSQYLQKSFNVIRQSF